MSRSKLCVFVVLSVGVLAAGVWAELEYGGGRVYNTLRGRLFGQDLRDFAKARHDLTFKCVLPEECDQRVAYDIAETMKDIVSRNPCKRVEHVLANGESRWVPLKDIVEDYELDAIKDNNTFAGSIVEKELKRAPSC